MPRLALITAITIALLSPAFPQSHPAAGTIKFVSLEGLFSIALPERSDFSRVTIPTPSGDAYGNQYVWKIKEGTFGVAYADTLQPINQPEAVKQFFDMTAERFKKLVEENGGKVAVTKNITLAERPGIEQRADMSGASVIRRVYLVSRRIYDITLMVQNSQREYENAALVMLDSFKLLSDAEITEEALKTGPGPLPQTPEAPRVGSDADEEGLCGPVKSVRTEIRYLSETPLGRMEPQSWLTTYNEKGNRLRKESYDSKNNLQTITVFGYLDGSRVSASKFIEREYVPAVRRGIGGNGVSTRKNDPRYDHRFEFKYDEKKRLLEETEFRSNGDISLRYVYKYEGNQKEELVYVADGSMTQRDLYILDDKGNAIEQTTFAPDGSVRSKRSYTYEYDSNGSWTKKTTSWKVVDEAHRRLYAPNIQVRTITYY
ncbi:MAG TPA: hypothetical protein VE931_07430 [Pyrinomonadaceae bacterium]|nr:hypothetical protein [Pyrinomonadaceae bacterium]